MNNEESLTALEQGDMINFINMSITKYQRSIIKSERDRCIKVKENIEKELYRNFLSHSVAIIKILNVYNEISQKSDEYNNLIEVYNELVGCLKFKHKVIHVDEQKQKRLFKIFAEFSDDMSYFKSNGRYYVHSVAIENIFLLMTNDLVFFAKNVSPYKLLHVLHYNLLSVRIFEERIEIKSDQFEYKLYKDEDTLIKIVGVFEERNESSINVKDDIDMEYIDFLEQTEQYDKLGKINHGRVMVYTEEELISLMNRLDELQKNEFIAEFLRLKFKDAIKRTKKIQKLSLLVKDCFLMFSGFREEQDILIKKCSLVGFEPFNICLLEEQIRIIFEFLEKRLLYSFDDPSIFNEISKLLSESGFGYLVFRVQNIKELYKSMILESAKSRLTALVDEI